MTSNFNIITIAFLVSALATTMVGAESQVVDSLYSVVMYTTGGQGFHRHLVLHLPISGASIPSSNGGVVTVPVTFELKLRNTFFIDVAEAENLWDAKLLSTDSEIPMALQVPTAVSRGDKGFVKAVKLRHPIKTQYFYDIEAPTVKTPYLYNKANITFDFTVDLSLVTKGDILAILSFPIHERYEDVTTNPAQTHVERCILAEDVTVRVGEGSLFKPLEGLPVHFTQHENTVAIVAAAGLGGSSALKSPGPDGKPILNAKQFCVRVPVGYLGDLPYFYWGTMSCMVLGATAVWAGLTFV